MALILINDDQDYIITPGHVRGCMITLIRGSENTWFTADRRRRSKNQLMFCKF